MMTWLEALVLGLIQGLTEYLPVSSSGHLAIGELFFGAFKGLEHRAPNAETKSGMLSDCEFHTHLLPLSEGLLTHYSILPIFIHSRSFSVFLESGNHLYCQNRIIYDSCGYCGCFL